MDSKPDPWVVHTAWMLLLIASCSSDASTPSRPRGSLAGRSADGETPSSTGTAGIGVENPGLLPSPPPPAANGGAPAMAPSDACEPGKFCAPRSPDPLDCGTLTLDQDIEITKGGNLLLVFDQSVSMSEPWGTAGQTKLLAAQTAIANAIGALGDSLTVGAIFFPTLACAPAGGGPGGIPGGGGPGGIPGVALGPAVNPIEAPEQIAFAPAKDFLLRWAEHWMMLGAGAGIGTPMQEAFDKADLAIQNPALQGPTAVVAVTDGAPNCFPTPDATMMPTALETDRAGMWLANKNIKTYVVGLPGAAGVDLLNNVAQSGGTMQYILPDDPKALEDKLREVVGETVKPRFQSCSINLTPAADPVDKLKMIVVEAQGGMESQVPRMLTATAGWMITPDGTHVEIMGELCDDAKGGRFTTITFEYGCKEPPELPPPPPLN